MGGDPSNWGMIEMGGGWLIPLYGLCIFIKDQYQYQYYQYKGSHLNYVDIIYDNPNNDSFKIKIENIQYKACIAIT